MNLKSSTLRPQTAAAVILIVTVLLAALVLRMSNGGILSAHYNVTTREGRVDYLAAQGWTVDPETEALLSQTQNRDRIIVLNKQDLPPCSETVGRFREDAVTVSCSSLEGMDRLKEKISGFTRAAGAGELSQLRHIMLAEQAAEALDRALALLEEGSGIDLAGIDLRDALDRLAAITGDRVDEALMESIFSRFCVGK